VWKIREEVRANKNTLNEEIIKQKRNFNLYRRESKGLIYTLLTSRFNIYFYTRLV